VSAEAHAVAWRHGFHALVCDQVESWKHGTIARATGFPTYYDYNLVRVEQGDPGLSAAELAGIADSALAGLAHRRVELEDLAGGERLWDEFVAMGWRAERLAYLWRELPGPEVAAPAGAQLRVEGFEATRPLRAAWKAEETHWVDAPEFYAVEEEVARRRGTRAAIAYAGGADPIGFAAFSAAGDAAEIELVYALPERRNGGLGGALVARALAEAAAGGAREAFIEADDVGDAKRLYERLGFRTVWRRCSFTRMPPRAVS
jgi:GNAT superfamily N-acetyltransferase